VNFGYTVPEGSAFHFVLDFAINEGVPSKVMSCPFWRVLADFERLLQVSRCTLQKLPMVSAVMQRLGSRVEQPFCVNIEAVGVAAFAHRTQFRDPGSLGRT
jgi:hypothetical protein